MNTPKVHNLICIGFGPAGIALAAAIEDDSEVGDFQKSWTDIFIEKRSDSSWQPGLLLPGTDINHHFLRDFATPRNPRSQFTFVNYLYEKGRLFHFGHLGASVGRLEWADYVSWTADKLKHHVIYNQAVLALGISSRNSDGNTICVRTPTQSYEAKNVVISTGPVVRLPEYAVPLLSDAVFHGSDFLSKVTALDREGPYHFCVVGSGQSAAEILLYLHSAFPNSRATSIHRTLGFKLGDRCHFSNECYFPSETDYVFSLPYLARKKVAEDTHRTNYSSIDFEISHLLYWRIYEDTVQGIERVKMATRRSIVAIERQHSLYSITLADVYTGSEETIVADVVILCTGYSEAPFPALLNDMRDCVRTEVDGRPRIDYDHRVQLIEPADVGIYLNGLSEYSHGISDSASFSMMALKADSILNSIKHK